MLDIARATTRGMHNLHRRRPRRRPHRAHVRHEPTRYDLELVRKSWPPRPPQPSKHGDLVNDARDLEPSQVTGTGFTGATAVKFGSTAATGVTVVSATKITAVVPAHSARGVNARVTTPSGTSAVVSADTYTYS